MTALIAIKNYKQRDVQENEYCNSNNYSKYFIKQSIKFGGFYFEP